MCAHAYKLRLCAYVTARTGDVETEYIDISSTALLVHEKHFNEVCDAQKGHLQNKMIKPTSSF